MIARKKMSIFVPVVLVVFMAAIYISIFIAPLVSEAWLAPRLVSMFPAVLAFLAICTVWTMNCFGNIKQTYLTVVTIALLPLTVLFLYQTANIGIGTHRVNAMDSLIVRSIEEKIRWHEMETGIAVTNLATKMNPIYTTWGYPGVFVTHDLNVRAWTVRYAIPGMFRVYVNRSLQHIEMPVEVYEQYFMERGRFWTNFSSDQVVIIGDTVYIYIY